MVHLRTIRGEKSHERPKEIELLFDCQGPQNAKARNTPLENLSEVHREEGVPQSLVIPLQVKKESSEQQESSIRGKNAEGAPFVESAPCSFLSPTIHEN
jgi:hypothetical protein